MKKVVIFDLDGTLANTLESIAYCTNRALNDFGFKSIPTEKVRKFIGNGARTQTIRSLREAGDQETAPVSGYMDDDGKNTFPVHLDQVLKRYMEYFETDCMYKVVPYDGILELLKVLKEKGILLAVLSNKPHPNTVSVVEMLFGTDTFDVVWGQKADIPKKPAPDGVFAILEKMRNDFNIQIQPDEVLYVGDSGVDMKTGKAAGAFTAGVLWGFRDQDELMVNGADALAAVPEELLSYIL